MKIRNKDTGEIDTVNDKQALAVIARSNGLWSEVKPRKTLKLDKRKKK